MRNGERRNSRKREGSADRGGNVHVASGVRMRRGRFPARHYRGRGHAGPSCATLLVAALRGSAARVALQQIADAEDADGDDKKAQHLAGVILFVELCDDRERRNGQSDDFAGLGPGCAWCER